jgi:hypothetical protein
VVSSFRFPAVRGTEEALAKDVLSVSNCRLAVISPAEGQAFAVRDSQDRSAMGAKIQTAFAQVTFQDPKPDRIYFFLAVRAHWPHVFFLREDNHGLTSFHQSLSLIPSCSGNIHGSAAFCRKWGEA